MATTLSTSALTEYVNVHKDELLTRATLDAVTLRYIDIMPNVKYKDVIPMLESTIQLQDGSVCGFSPNGSDTFGDKAIETKAWKVEKEWCWKEFEKTFANYSLLWEAGRENTDYCEKMAEHNLGLIQEAVEEMVWSGDTTIGLTGITELVTSVESGDTIAASGITTASTIADIVDAVVAAIPMTALKKGVNVFMSYTNLRKYILAQNAVCCANRPVQDAAAGEFIYVGDSRVTLVGVGGIGDNFFCAASKDAIVYATDIEGSENVYKLWYNLDEDKVRFRVLARSGVALRHPEEIAYYKA